jgi:tetratricopeptide (TPR) repeat protein
VLFPVSCVNAASFSDAARTFLTQLDIPAITRDSLLVIASDDSGKNSYIAQTASGVYSFASKKILTDKDEDIQREIEAATGNFLILRARRDLVTYLMKRQVNRKHYPNNDALDNAVYSLYERNSIAGTQFSTEVVGNWIFVLVWFESAVAKAIQDLPIETSELNNDYCTFLYERAKTLFEQGKYSGALSIFKHIHDYRWANVSLYLDTAESFLKTGESEESLKLLKELRSTLDDKMSSDDLERAGKLFRANGDRKAALDSFKEARKRYQKGQ